MYYHTIVITLFSFLKKSEDSKEGSSVSKDSANEAFSSARAIAQLMETQRLTWGIQILPSSSIQWITVSLFTLLDDMDEPESIKAFVSLCVAAKAASRRWPLGKGMLRAVQLQARQAGVSLPMETQTLFVDFESASWSSKDLENLSSLYPNFAMSVKSGKNDDIELDKFLKRWDGLNLRMGN